MHAAAISPRGGVSPRGTLLRGQSIIEYVLIIAVIGLVIVFAGPGVAGTIRNQFNLVGNTVNNGTTGGVGGGASGGDSTGTASVTVQAAVAKDAKDWTLDEQEAVAEDIAKNGTSSIAYAKAKAAMDARITWSVRLTDGKTLEYKIIGINHDDLAGGSGKAGLTFLTISTGIKSRMNAANSSAGGWEKSELRQKMNSGEIWSLMPSDLQSKVKAVTKLTNNVVGIDKNAAGTATSDKLFLLSYSEVVPTSYWASSYPWTSSEGTQYEAFKGRVTENHSDNSAIAIGDNWFERSKSPDKPGRFLFVRTSGDPASDFYYASMPLCVCPAWCF
jgi:Flp pilus assembly pilin Flp